MADEKKPRVSEGKPVRPVRLLTAWAASTGLLLILVVLIAEWSLRQIEVRARFRAREDAVHRIEVIRNRIRDEAATHPAATLETIVRSAWWLNVVLNRQASTGENIEWIAVVSPEGAILAVSEDHGRTTASAVTRPADESVVTTVMPSADGKTVQYGVPVILNEKELGTVQIRLAWQGLDAVVDELQRPVLRAFLLLGTAGVVVLLIGGIVMRQLRNQERMLDRALARQEQQAAMSALARRMVHEIRNPLNAMRMQIAVIQDMLADPATMTESVRTEQLGRLDQEVSRVEKLAKSFLAFGRPPKDELESFRPADLIRDVAEFIRPAFERIGARVDVEVDHRGERSKIRMDQSKLREVLLNLAENAREAMDGGRLLIRLAGRSQQEISIQVEDTGRGIAADDLPRAFQGLCSTKTDGSGLGLLIVKRIVEDAGGTIRVESQVNRGTCFELVLPLFQGDTAGSRSETGAAVKELS